MIASVVVALVGVLSWDARGLVAEGAGPAVPPAADLPEVASTAPSGFDALTARLRLAPVEVAAPPPAVEVTPIEPAPAPQGPAGDLAISPPPAFQGHGSVEAAHELPPSRYDAATATGGTWALVIGINDYPGIAYDLRSAVNDANDVNDALAQLGVTNDRRLVLRDAQADAGTIRAALDWLSAHAGGDSTMVLFFAGHVQRIDRGREAFVGSDGGIVTDLEVAAMLDRSPAQRAWIAVAGCYGGGFDEVVRPGRILTAAAPSDRVAYENEGFGRSYLVEFMVRRAMLGQGMTTVEGAFSWASAELQRDYPDRVPVQLDAIGGELDLRAGPPPPAAAPPPGSSSAPPPSSDPPKERCTLSISLVRCS